MSTFPELPLHAEAERRWNLDWIEGQSLLMVRPRLLHGIAIYAGQYYDTALARVDGSTIVPTERKGWKVSVPSVTPTTMFCGLSVEEYHAVCESQQMPKAAVLVDDPLCAISTQWANAPTFEQPVIVARMTKPMPARAGGLTSVITEVYVGRPYRISAGQIAMERIDNRWAEGARQSPTSWLVWKRLTPGTRIEAEPHAYRLGWCLTCDVPRYDCVGNERSGNRGHKGRPGERGGSAPGELHSAGDALHSLLNGEKVNIHREEVREFVERARDQYEDPDITDMHVEGMLIYGGNGLGIARKDMPQIPREHREGFLKELKDQGIEVRKERVSPLSLAPTQREISARLVGEKLKAYEDNPDKEFPPLLVAEDSHVLDGHHHWGAMATVAIDSPKAKVPIHRIMTTPKKALDIMHAYDKAHGIERKALAHTPTKDKKQGKKIAASEVIPGGTTYDLYGTAASGNRGHAGRPGERGGSAPSDGGSDSTSALTTQGTGEFIDQPDSTVPELGTERPDPRIVDNVPDAVAAILKGEVIEIQDVRHVHTVLSKLAEMANDAKAKGENAPDYDLCKVSVAGSNLFCGSPLKTKDFPNGVPRIKMPQFSGKPVPGSRADALPRSERGGVDATELFKDYLKAVKIPASEVHAVPASHLKATQSQLVGPTVAGMMTDKTYDPAADPIFISSDNYVLDGHHRWAAVVGRDAEDGKLGNSTMNVIRVDAPMSELYFRAKKFAKEVGIKPKHGRKTLHGYAARVFSLLGERFLLDGWDEGEHPRDGSGKFDESGGGDTGRPAQTPAQLFWDRLAAISLIGTSTSGNYDHEGRPGHVGGSGPGGGESQDTKDAAPKIEAAAKPKDLTEAEKAALPHTDTLIVSKTAPPKDKPVTLTFGGSFNPPHDGHVKAMDDAVRLMEAQGYTVDKVVIAPVGDVLLKKKLGDKRYPLKDRVEMAKRMFTDPRFEVASGPGDETDNWPKGEKLKRTQLADWASKRNAGTTVVNVTGEDAVPGRENIEGFPSVFEGDKGTSHEGYHYLAVKRETTSASSTKIRTAIKEGTTVPNMTPEAEAYLRDMLAKNPHIQLSFDPDGESWFDLYGTASSGNRGHAGRPGQRGGSAPSEGGGDESDRESDYRFVEPSAARIEYHANLIRSDPESSQIERDNAELFGRAEAISEAELQLHGATEDRYATKDEKGAPHYTGERLALHKETIRKLTDGPPKGLDKPVAIILGGLTAAGKSTFVDSLKEHVDMGQYVQINADDMKEALPEYNGENAAVVHEESSHMAKIATARAIQNRQNLVLDATMGSAGSVGDKGMLGQIERLKVQGYDVQVMFMDVDVDTSVHRSMNRYKEATDEGKGARYVPGRIIREARDPVHGSKPRATFEAIKESGLLDGANDGWIMIDNRGPGGPTTFPSRTKEGRGGGKVIERKGNLVIPSTHLKPAEHGE